jgi:hypothetical protein
MKIRGTSGTKPVRLLHRAIPILTWFQYAQKPSGTAVSLSTNPLTNGADATG